MVVPDERNNGGRVLIEREHLRMREGIVGARPRINTAAPWKPTRTFLQEQRRARQSASVGSVKGRRDAFAETRETYRRVANAHAPRTANSKMTMTAPPESYGMASVISANRRTKRAYADRKTLDHAVNVYHMHRRMDSMGSVTERKKNRFDASVYPSLIRRSSKAGPKLNLQPLGQLGGSPARPSTSHGVRASAASASSARKSLERPRTAPPASMRASGGGGVDLYETFKLAMMDEIIEMRLYEESKIHALFKRYLKHNSSATHPHLLRAIEDIKQDLDVA